MNNANGKAPLAPEVDVRRPEEGVAVVSLTGEHDLTNADDLEALLVNALETSTHLVVDLSDAAFIDSSIINALVTTRRRAEAEHRQFNLVLGTSEIVERVLTITDVLPYLNRTHTLEEALSG
jgi:anti-anti-sigma factor